MTPGAQRHDDRWEIVARRDRSGDGEFVYAVLSTRIFCRPSCPSRRPLRKNVVFYDTPAAAEGAGFHACKRCRPKGKTSSAALVDAACAYIARQAGEKFSLAELSRHLGVSRFYFVRLFKRAVGVTPAAYARSLRLGQFKTKLTAGTKVIDAIYDAGFSSTSRAYEHSALKLGMTPTQYRDQGRGKRIEYGAFRTELGLLLLAMTDKGVCAVRFGESKAKLLQELRSEFSRAEITEIKDGSPRLRAAFSRIESHLRGGATAMDLPLDVQATSFQARVWKALQQTQRGETVSYSELARRIASPAAVRAVARACAANPVALVVPCHRVIRSDGNLAGYRWGIARKRKLLQLEAGARIGSTQR